MDPVNSERHLAPLLCAYHLHKKIGQKTILDNVSIDVFPGEIVGLFGANGAGKTTCFLMLSGLHNTNLKGKVILKGRDISSLPLYKRAHLGLGYVAQHTAIFPQLTLLDNVLLALWSIKNIHEKIKKAEKALEYMNLLPMAKEPAWRLSGGEQRRMELARILVQKPSVLLLDEPLTGIDPKNIQELHTHIAHMASQNMGIIITDHQVKQVLPWTHRAYILHKGRIVAQGTPQELKENPIAQDVYLGTNS